MVVRQKLGYIIWITYYMKVFYLFYEKIMKYVCSFTHSSNLCPVPIGNFSILPKWHFWTHAWNSKLFLPKDFFWGIMNRPGYFYLFGKNRDWHSRDNLKIFGKVGKFWAAQSPVLNFHIILKICFSNKWIL